MQEFNNVVKSSDNNLTIKASYSKDTISTIDIELSDKEVLQRIRKLSQQVVRKNTVLYMNALKDLGKDYPLIKIMYNFINDSALFERYLILAAIDCRRININLETKTIVFLAGAKQVPALNLGFGINNECVYALLYIASSTTGDTYACREIEISKYTINDDISIKDNEYSFISNDPKNPNTAFVEVAVYRTYFEQNDSMDQCISKAITTFKDGAEYDERQGSTRCPYIYDKYYGEATIGGDNMIYRGTYFSKDKPICNLYRIYKISNKKDTAFISSVEYNSLYDIYNMHLVLFRDQKAQAKNNKFLSMNTLLITETVEYDKEFFWKFPNDVKELPGTKNYYYGEGFVLEVSSVEYKGKGRQLKITKNYYKVFKNTCWDTPEKAYVIRPDCLSLENNGTLYMYFEAGNDDAYFRVSDREADESESAKLKKESIEKVISEVCQQVGVQYK